MTRAGLEPATYGLKGQSRNNEPRVSQGNRGNGKADGGEDESFGGLVRTRVAQVSAQAQRDEPKRGSKGCVRVPESESHGWSGIRPSLGQHPVGTLGREAQHLGTCIRSL
jgi:hypothetical protein